MAPTRVIDNEECVAPAMWKALAWALLLVGGGVEGIDTNITNFCSPHVDPPLIVKGQTTHVCVNVNDKYRTVFTPIADYFTVLRVDNSWNDSRIGGDPHGAYISVSSLSNRTTYKLYSSDRGKIYPFLTAIISVKKGVVQGITWDDGCYFCDPDTCESNLYRAPTNVSSQLYDQGNTCFNQRSQCAGANATTCDITVYVGWTGTDKNGNYLSSAGLRMSQFQKYSIGSFFKNLKNKFDVFLPASHFDT
ncbi:TPA: hypothetical protein N0F65_009283 [Lagenidium giganteum]|uniref:Uncharacterized protein n=1 Tax=Lagenidium giganteum TaxID=4803 RepID=A0AAV2YRY6_9STRA|nr:TPA: hypothetical protein N0F65_009283 [Lagenidium giganteum]